MLIKWWLQNSAHMAVHGRPKQVFFRVDLWFQPWIHQFLCGKLFWGIDVEAFHYGSDILNVEGGPDHKAPEEVWNTSSIRNIQMYI